MKLAAAILVVALAALAYADEPAPKPKAPPKITYCDYDKECPDYHECQPLPKPWCEKVCNGYDGYGNPKCKQVCRRGKCVEWTYCEPEESDDYENDYKEECGDHEYGYTCKALEYPRCKTVKECEDKKVCTKRKYGDKCHTEYDQKCENVDVGCGDYATKKECKDVEKCEDKKVCTKRKYGDKCHTEYEDKCEDVDVGCAKYDYVKDCKNVEKCEDKKVCARKGYSEVCNDIPTSECADYVNVPYDCKPRCKVTGTRTKCSEKVVNGKKGRWCTTDNYEEDCSGYGDTGCKQRRVCKRYKTRKDCRPVEDGCAQYKYEKDCKYETVCDDKKVCKQRKLKKVCVPTPKEVCERVDIGCDDYAYEKECKIVPKCEDKKYCSKRKHKKVCVNVPKEVCERVDIGCADYEYEKECKDVEECYEGKCVKKPEPKKPKRPARRFKHPSGRRP